MSFKVTVKVHETEVSCEGCRFCNREEKKCDLFRVPLRLLTPGEVISNKLLPDGRMFDRCRECWSCQNLSLAKTALIAAGILCILTMLTVGTLSLIKYWDTIKQLLF